MLSAFRNSKRAVQQKLTEGIKHLESLPLDAFIDAVKNIDKFVATEKLDGYNLWFGFDATGFYTSRGGKGGEAKFRSVDEYVDRPANNGFRAVHAALQQAERILKRFIRDGECVEVEVLFGRQPNAIVYGSNMIAFLRYVEGGDTARLDQLTQTLDGKTVKTTTTHTVTSDGLELKNETQTHSWQFVRPAQLNDQIERHADVERELQELEAYTAAANDRIPSMTNGQVAQANLTSVEAHMRDVVKFEREAVQDTIAHDFVLPIKAKLVDQLLRNATPSLQTAELKQGEDVGIEGIVFLDPDTNEQFKLVDKDAFTTINKFNFAVRSAIKSTSMGGGRNPFTASLGISDDGSVFDHYTATLGRLFGLDEHMKYYDITRALRSHGSTPQEVVDALVAQAPSPSTLQRDVLYAIEQADQELRKLMAQFKNTWRRYSTQLPNGKTVKYSAEIYNRTMTSFAEAHQEFLTLHGDVKNALTPQHVVAVVFSRQLDKLTK